VALKSERDSADAYPEAFPEEAMGQLSRILLSSTSGSPDEQAAVPEEGQGYGELMEDINRVLQDAPDRERDLPSR